MYLISDDDTRPETRWHAREALNFQLTFLTVILGSFVIFFLGFGLGIGGAFSTTSDESSIGVAFGLGMTVFFLLVIGSTAANIVFSVIGAVRANSGVRWTYPIRIPFVRG